MKKLITVILILSLILPVAACASNNYFGCWGVWIPKSAALGYGNLSFVIVLNEDYTFAWLLVDDSLTTGLYTSTITGKWKSDGDTVTITNDTGEEGCLNYYDDMLWIEMTGKNVGLKKLQDFDVSQMVYIDQ